MSFIQESKNKQEDRGLELIMVSMEERCGFHALRGISKTFYIEIKILN